MVPEFLADKFLVLNRKQQEGGVNRTEHMSRHHTNREEFKNIHISTYNYREVGRSTCRWMNNKVRIIDVFMSHNQWWIQDFKRPKTKFLELQRSRRLVKLISLSMYVCMYVCKKKAARIRTVKRQRTRLPAFESKKQKM